MKPPKKTPKPKKAPQSPPPLSYLERILMHRKGLERKEFPDLGTLLADNRIPPTRAMRLITWHVKRAGKWAPESHARIIRAIRLLYQNRWEEISKKRKTN